MAPEDAKNKAGEGEDKEPGTGEGSGNSPPASRGGRSSQAASPGQLRFWQASYSLGTSWLPTYRTLGRSRLRQSSAELRMKGTARRRKVRRRTHGPVSAMLSTI